MLTVEVGLPMQLLEAAVVEVVRRSKVALDLALGLALATVQAKRVTGRITILEEVMEELLALEVMVVVAAVDKLRGLLAPLAMGLVVALGQVLVQQAMDIVHLQMLTLMLVVEVPELVKMAGAEVAPEVEMVTLMVTSKPPASSNINLEREPIVNFYLYF